MAFEKLKDFEKEIVKKCLTAIINGNFIDDLEFQIRLGVEKQELQTVINAYPNIVDDDNTSIEVLCINNCLNEICFGLNISEDNWTKRFDVSKEQIKDVYKKWAKLKGLNVTGIQ